MKNTDIKTTEITTPATFNIEALIGQAIINKVPLDTMKEMLAMRKELKAEWAKEEFDKAMAAFQKQCPVINKSKKVFEKNSETKVRYTFAPLEDIATQIKPYLSKCGLSYRFKTIQTETTLAAVCVTTHISGHSEETAFEVPLGTEDYMSNVQKYGARLTFAKRYALCNAFGISTGNEDDETLLKKSDKTEQKQLTKEQVDAINNANTQEALIAVCKSITTIDINLKPAVVEEYERRKEEIKQSENSIDIEEVAEAIEAKENK